jgi:hypothetical protein
MVRAQVEAAAFAVLIYEPQPSQAWGCIKIIGDFMAAYRVLRCVAESHRWWLDFGLDRVS